MKLKELQQKLELRIAKKEQELSILRDEWQQVTKTRELMFPVIDKVMEQYRWRNDG